MSLSGKCLCELITFEITGPPRPVINCHCSTCRRHPGHFIAGDYHPFDDMIPSYREDSPEVR